MKGNSIGLWTVEEGWCRGRGTNGLLLSLHAKGGRIIRATQKHITRNWGKRTDIFVSILKLAAGKRDVHGVTAEEAKDKADEVFDYASFCT
jgi:hypothetical protein